MSEISASKYQSLQKLPEVLGSRVLDFRHWSILAPKGQPFETIVGLHKLQKAKGSLRANSMLRKLRCSSRGLGNFLTEQVA